MKPEGWAARPRGRLALLVVVALAARTITFGNPILHPDEQFYLVVARAMWGGAWPYADIWDRKPVGLFLLYMPPAALPLRWAVPAYQAMALAAAVATAWMIDRLARRGGWDRGALLGGIAYLLWIDLASGQGGQSPIFYNPLVAGAALLIADAAPSWRRSAAAMLLIGLAIQIKTSVVFEGLFFGLWLVIRHRHAHRCPAATLGYAALLAGIALLPTLAAAAVFAASGHGDAWVFANVTSILGRHADPWREQLGNLAGVVLILSPLVAMAGVTLAEARAARSDSTRALFFGWLGAALVGLAVFGTWFDHYALPVMVPACVCAAGAMGDHRRVRRWAVLILLTVAIGGQLVLAGERKARGTPAQFAAVADAVGRGPGCLWVYSGDAMLYAATDRCRASRFVFPSHLVRVRETGAVGVDQVAEVRRILATTPAVIVMRPPYRGERPEMRRLVQADLRRNYVEAAALPLGKGTIAIFKPR